MSALIDSRSKIVHIFRDKIMTQHHAVTKNIPPDIMDALKIITQSLESKNIEWIVITSCGLALQGLDIHPDDIDILTNEEGFTQIAALLNNYANKQLKILPSEKFSSPIRKFLIGTCNVEVMCNFKIRSAVEGAWLNMNKMLLHKNIIEVEKCKIPVLPLLQSAEMYALMGREKDIIKIQKIEQYLEAHRA
jgi:hypothetical protein